MFVDIKRLGITKAFDMVLCLVIQGQLSWKELSLPQKWYIWGKDRRPGKTGIWPLLSLEGIPVSEVLPKIRLQVQIQEELREPKNLWRGVSSPFFYEIYPDL